MHHEKPKCVIYSTEDELWQMTKGALENTQRVFLEIKEYFYAAELTTPTAAHYGKKIHI